MNTQPATMDPTHARRLAETEALSTDVLARDPQNPDALNALGLVRLSTDDAAAAVELFERAVQAAPEEPTFRENLAGALDRKSRHALDARNLDIARRDLERAHALAPAHLLIACHLAFVLSLAGEHAAALDAAAAALTLDSDSVEAHDVMGLALGGLDRGEDAVACFERAIELDDSYAPAHTNLGNAVAGRGDRVRALAFHRRADMLKPNDAETLNNLGNALAANLELAEAEACLRRAVALKPQFAEAHFNLAMALLMQEKFHDGWAEYEWRWGCPEFPSTRRVFPYPVWQGEELRGKTLLIWSEQGVGDEIMFADAIPDVVAAGARLVIECNERFVPIFERSFPGAVLCARRDPANSAISAAGIDYQISMASLCLHYRRDTAAFPAAPGAYLMADEEQRGACRARYDGWGDGLKIGISWRSGNPVVGTERSAPIALWDGILCQPDCVLVSLQYGDVADDIADVQNRLGVEIHVDDGIDPLASMDDWLAQVAAMDLVVSVDNSTVQVSGSLGVPTWTLLSYVPEWRWLAAGSHSPWHPHMQVFRQTRPGDWAPVFDAVGARLHTKLKGDSPL